MATNKATRKLVPPSRESYEESHPVILVRVTPEMRERLELLKNASGMTAADVLRVGLDQAQPAIEEAFDVGYGDAEWRLKVTFRCSGCGRGDLSVETPEEAEAVGEFLSRNGWHCPRCR
jgi:hypothetical protein